MESGGTIRWVRMRLVQSLACPVGRTSPSTCRQLTLAGLGVSPGGFRAESRAVLGKSQAPRVEASQGFYYSGFIQPNKETNKPSWYSSEFVGGCTPHQSHWITLFSGDINKQS